MLYACREHPAVQRVLDTGEPEFVHVTIASCGHEVYDYEHMYVWEGKTLCPDCLTEAVAALPPDELAELLGCEILGAQR